MRIVEILRATIDDMERQVIEVLRMGKDDVQEINQIGPFGVDSVPIKQMRGVQAETGVSGEAVIIGYINKHALAKSGEMRLFSVNDNDELQTFLYLKKDGTMLLGGEVDNAVRFNQLNLGFQQYNADIIVELVAIAAGITTAGGAYTPNPTLAPDISGAKIDEIKTS